MARISLSFALSTLALLLSVQQHVVTCFRTASVSQLQHPAAFLADTILHSVSVAEKEEPSVASPWRQRLECYKASCVQNWDSLTLAATSWYSERPTVSWHVARAWCVAVAQNYWWALPLSLCAVPPVSLAAFQTPAMTPSFWKMVRMDHIWASPDALFVVACFLLSNIFYFGSAGFLLQRMPPRKAPGRFPVPCRYSGLGFWVLAAGLMSTIFHAVQALGDTVLAEGLCYLDHGIAISACWYFFHVCGAPSKKTWILGGLGVIALALPLKPGYAWLHSLWHLLSAAAALTWTQQGKLQRRQDLLQAVRAKRSA